MAARLAFAWVKNHSLGDGNKRIGVLAMRVFLGVNGIPYSILLLHPRWYVHSHAVTKQKPSGGGGYF
jgi:hypothetical protein